MTSTIVGKNPQKKWSSPHNQQESKMQYLGATTKVAEDLGSFPRQTIQRHSNSNLGLYHLKSVEKLIS